MDFLKSRIKGMLGRFGYALKRNTEPNLRFDNFINLAKSYELLINDTGFEVPPNESRYMLLARLLGTPPSEAYFIIDALAKTAAIDGVVCEFGVAQGETSALIANELMTGTRAFHLFDSFEGLPDPTVEDQLKDDIFSLGSMSAYAGTMSYPQQFLEKRLKAVSFPPERIVVHEGFIDKVFKESKRLPRRVSFAYVDFDFYKPIKQTLEFLDQVTSRGSMIIVDDYDFFSSGVKTAVDEFITAQNSAGPIYTCTVPDAFGCFAVITRTS